MKNSNINLIALIFALFIPNIIQAQECAGIILESANGAEQLGCGRSGSDYLSHYRHLETYIPNQNTAEKVLHVNLIVWQLDDGTGNWQNNSAQLSRLNQIMEWVNTQYFDKNAAPSDPIPGVTELLNLDKKIHIELEGIYFFQNSACALSSSAGNKVSFLLANAPELLNELNIHIISNQLSFSGATGYSNGPNVDYPLIVSSNDPNGMGYNCTPGPNVPCPISVASYRDWNYAHHLAHEIAHNLDLQHVYNSGREECDMYGLDYMDDIFPINATWCNPPSPPSGCNVCVQNMGSYVQASVSTTDGWTNNLMNGYEGNYISPKQAGKIHRACSTLKIGRFVSGFSATPIELNQNETWDFPMQLFQPLIIKSGSTLTLTCELRMPQDGYILIEPGAKLLIDGGRVTKSNSHAGEWWKGIYLQGDNTKAQIDALQAKIEIINGGTISYARDAITTIGIDQSGNWIWGTQGGIIEANNANFINNRRDIQFLAYTPPFSKNEKYRCSITNSNFERNVDYSIEVVEPSITAWNVFGLQIRHCTFTSDPTVTNISYKGGAIYTLGATYQVHENNLGQGCSFSGYADAIRSIGSLSVAFPISIIGAIFSDNIHSIYISGSEGTQVSYNNISVRGNHNHTPINLPWQFSAYGIYLDGCQMFNINDNTVLNLDGVNNLSVGIVVKDSYGTSDNVHNNTVDAFYNGFQALGINRRPTNASEGVKLTCNNMGSTTANSTDFLVEDNGSLPNDLSTSTNQLPNNQFSISAGNRNFDNLGPGIFYEYGTGNSRVSPTNYLGLTIIPYSGLADVPGSCISFPKPPITNSNPVFEDLFLSEGLLQSKEQLKKQLVDEGSTPELEAKIIMASSPIDQQMLYIDLMNISPYVSIENLERLITLSGFPELALRNIFVANPHGAREPQLWEGLVNRVPLLSQQTLIDIENGQQTITLMDVLNRDIAYLQSKSQSCYSDLMKFYSEKMSDTNINYLDSLHSLLSNTNSLHLRHSLIEQYISEGNSNAAQFEISNIANNCLITEDEVNYNNSLLDVYNILVDCINFSKRPNNLSAVEISKLYQIESYNLGRPSSLARYLLSLNGQSFSYVEPIFQVTTANKMETRRDLDRPDHIDYQIRATPNPVSESLTITWDWVKLIDYSKLQIILFDMHGKQIFEISNVPVIENSAHVRIKGFPTAYYLLEIRADGTKIHSEKIQLIE